MSKPFELLLFSTDPAFARLATDSGVGGLVIDWEHVGKGARQAFADTEINRDTVHDLRRMRAGTQAPIICRINRLGEGSNEEVEQAIAAGADEILLPMVQRPEEVQQAVRQAADRCGVGILVETNSAVQVIKELAKLPLSRVYVGLNDLAIERGTRNIFTALVDGTMDKLRAEFDVPFGFGGLTLPDRGDPIPCRLLIGEMARLQVDFSFLRRSFHRDIRGRDIRSEIPRLLRAISEARSRPPDSVNRDRDALKRAVQSWPHAIAIQEKVLADAQSAP